MSKKTFQGVKPLTPLVVWYQNKFQTNFATSSSYYQNQLANNPNNLTHLANVLIFENHQWYLKVYKRCQTSVNQLVNHLINLPPWDAMINGCHSFENLYEKIVPQVGIKYVGQLTYYDIALRMVKMYNRQDLMPAELVYLHAQPLTGYSWLYKAGYVSEKPSNTVQYQKISADFPGLSSNEIEDVLCHFTKLLPSMQSLGKTFGQLSQQEAANIIDGILNGLCNASSTPSGTSGCGPTKTKKISGGGC